MKRIADWRGVAASDRGAAIALGNFDGVHRGHQAVIDRARASAEAKGAPLGVAVFKPHPRRFFQPQTGPFRLTSNDMRAHILADLGVAALYEIPFDRELSLRDDRAFARDVLADGLGIASVTVGFDYRFGKDRVGDATNLARLGKELGFDVEVVEAVEAEGGKCSSTAIRRALQEGDVGFAERALTRPWIIDGVVERGDQRGRQLGFPTANVGLGVLVRPKFGVYAFRARLDGEAHWRPGVANIGVRPTFEGSEERVEAHFFDFDADIYGRRVEIGLQAFIRPERKFEGLEALKAQIAADVEAVKAALNAR